MKTASAGIAISLLLSLTARADDRITLQEVQQVIDATDAAAEHRDTARIGQYLSGSFEKVLEFTYGKYLAKVRIDRDKYLKLIRDGWSQVESYTYQRDDTEIHLLPDGSHAETYSTITEHSIRQGKRMTSKVREYATYGLENGKPVITEISNITLVGDSSPVY
jgi:hypothetical protein